MIRRSHGLFLFVGLLSCQEDPRVEAIPADPVAVVTTRPVPRTAIDTSIERNRFATDQPRFPAPTPADVTDEDLARLFSSDNLDFFFGKGYADDCDLPEGVGGSKPDITNDCSRKVIQGCEVYSSYADGKVLVSVQINEWGNVISAELAGGDQPGNDPNHLVSDALWRAKKDKL